MCRDPVPGLFVYPDEDLVTVVHALVTGPFDTPYEGGEILERPMVRPYFLMLVFGQVWSVDEQAA